MKNNKIWFVTGCSTGFGRCLTEELLKLNHKVVATARDTKSLNDLVQKYPDHLLTLQLDVTQKNHIQLAVDSAIKKFGRIDVLVNNAGYGMIGALEESSDSEIKRIFDTNVFGLIDMTKAVLPIMRSQKSGHVVNISSVAGIVSTPGFGIYNATKFAVEGLSEALANEVAGFGIRVLIIEPGPFRTDFASRSLSEAEPRPEYEEAMKNTRQYMKNMNGNQPGDPVKAALAIIKLVEMESAPLRLPFGKLAVERIDLKIKKMTSDIRTHEKLILGTDYGVD